MAMTKYLAILALVSQTSAFTVVTQSRSNLSVSHLLLLLKSSGRTFKVFLTFFILHFVLQLHALPFDPASFTESSGLLDKLISLPLDPAGIADSAGADGLLQVRLMYVYVRKISLMSFTHWYFVSLVS